ncbi:hypothetical protein [Bacillus salacetis]|uniref:hypothetical protein n=1 Tax=Bacillus salacetis TaxID=2315464 RepID=UPI00109BB75D|nr:hypothetical protein [Bacillus salacetis]
MLWNVSRFSWSTRHEELQSEGPLIKYGTPNEENYRKWMPGFIATASRSIPCQGAAFVPARLMPVGAEQGASALVSSSSSAKPLGVISQSVKKVKEQPSRRLVLCLSGLNKALPLSYHPAPAPSPSGS